MRRTASAALMLTAMILLVCTTFPGIGSAMTGVNERVNVSSSGVQANDGDPAHYSINETGNRIVFESQATNLVSNDTNGSSYDIFLRDRNSSTTTMVDISSSGVQANAGGSYPRISKSGRYIVYSSAATNLTTDGGSSTTWQIYLYDVTNQTTELVSKTASGTIANGYTTNPDVSSDGRFVVFRSAATNLASGSNGNMNIFVKDRLSGTITEVTNGNGDSHDPRIDCSGRFVAFSSQATNITSTYSGHFDVYVADLEGANPVLTDIVPSANSDSARPTLSCGADYVAFDSVASNLVSGDTNGKLDVFRYDRVNGLITRVSVSSAGTQGNQDSIGSDISDNGQIVAYYSNATNLVSNDTNSKYDEFTTDTKTNTTSLVAGASTTTQSNGDSFLGLLSGDAKYVVYESYGTNLISGDTNGVGDIFVSTTGY